MAKVITIGCISDGHGYELSPLAKPMPEVDLLIYSGDATIFGNTKEFKKTIKWFDGQKAAKKIFVPGNHDLTFDPEKKETQPGQVQRRIEMFTDAGIEVLIDQFTWFENCLIYGTPWVPNLPRWAFSRNELDMQVIFSAIPDGVDILISHGPPHGIMDKVVDRYGKDKLISVGSTSLREAVKAKKPKLHVFGHIHECYGTHIEDDTVFVNAAMCNESYAPVNAPVIIRMNTETRKVEAIDGVAV